MHPILQFYGPGAKLVTNYNLDKEAGSSITFGQCPDVPCFRITLLGIRRLEGKLMAELMLSEVWKGADPRSVDGPVFPLPLKRGCSMTFKTKLWDITFAIEDDRASYFRAGIGLPPGTYSGEGFQAGTRGEDC